MIPHPSLPCPRPSHTRQGGSRACAGRCQRRRRSCGVFQERQGGRGAISYALAAVVLTLSTRSPLRGRNHYGPPSTLPRQRLWLTACCLRRASIGRPCPLPPGPAARGRAACTGVPLPQLHRLPCLCPFAQQPAHNKCTAAVHTRPAPASPPWRTWPPGTAEWRPTQTRCAGVAIVVGRALGGGREWLEHLEAKRHQAAAEAFRLRARQQLVGVCLPAWRPCGPHSIRGRPPLRVRPPPPAPGRVKFGAREAVVVERGHLAKGMQSQVGGLLVLSGAHVHLHQLRRDGQLADVPPGGVGGCSELRTSLERQGG